MELKYLKDNVVIEKYERAEKIIVSNSEPRLFEVDNGYILPTRKCPELVWGCGGVIDKKRNFVPASGVSSAFGKYYEFDESDVKKINSTVIFIGIIPKQVGHFFIDSICRYWFLLREESKAYKIAFCSYYWDSNPLEDKFGEVFSLLKINRSRLIHIKKPTFFSKILIPEPTMSFSGVVNKEYKKVINALIKSAIIEGNKQKWTSYDKIYLNKRFYFPANIKQVGELQIENLFKKNGFSIVSPERCSLSQMIYLVHNCKIMASLSGTSSHYSMFSSSNFKLISLNRLPLPLLPQMRIDALFEIDDVFIDCYNNQMIKKGNEYGLGVIWVEISENLIKYANDSGMTLSSKDNSCLVRLKNTFEYYIKNSIYQFIPIYKKIIGR